MKNELVIFHLKLQQISIFYKNNLQQILPLPELSPRRRRWERQKRADSRQTWLKSSELFELQHASDLVSFEVTTQGLKAPPHDFLPQILVIDVAKFGSELSSKVAFHGRLAVAAAQAAL